MAKKIRFPLDMGNGIEVRTLEELQENFSVEKVLGYYADGKLLIWLKDRYLDDIADAISGLDKDDSDFAMKICNAFGVEYNEEFDIEELEERNRKLKILKQYTEDKQYVDVVDDIAFDQDELYDLLDEDKHTIYLCGDNFSIPLSKKGVHYIGINLPEVVISSKEKIDFEGKGIQLENVKFDEQYQGVLNNNKNKVNTMIENANNCSYEDDLYTIIENENLLVNLTDIQEDICCGVETREEMEGYIKSIINIGHKGGANGYQILDYFKSPFIVNKLRRLNFSQEELAYMILEEKG